MKKTAILALILAAAVAAAGCAAPAAVQSPPDEPSAPVIEQEEPALLGAFQAEDINGNTADAGIFEGHKLTMVNIWATFCGPCIREMPDLATLHGQYDAGDFQVVGIVLDAVDSKGEPIESVVELARWIADTSGADYLHLLPSQELVEAHLKNVSAVPETLFVDSEGRKVGETYLGARSLDDWTGVVDGLLAEAG